MTLEEKAKAYDEALEIARQIHNGNPSSGTAIVVCEQIFPQLRESEDEKIRKELIFFLKEEIPQCSIKEHTDKLKEFVSYLEKQKERGPLTKEEEYILHRIIEYLEDETCPPEWISLLYDIYCLPYEKQKEQKPVNWTELTWKDIVELEGIINNVHYDFSAGIGQESFGKEVLERFRNKKDDAEVDTCEQKPSWNEEDLEEDIQTRFAFYTYKDEPEVVYLSNVFVEESSRHQGLGTRILKAAEMVAKTYGATTIRLRVRPDSPAKAWYLNRGYIYMKFDGEYQWLEKYLSKADQNLRDEMIRRDIVAVVEMNEDLTQGRKAEIYAYLENQKEKEQKPAEWSEEELNVMIR